MSLKPLVGFFPVFFNLGEATHLVEIAKCYKELGGEAIFFSHGGEYEYLAKEIGCKVIQVNPIYTNEEIERLWKFDQMEQLTGEPFPEGWLVEHVEAEVLAYQETGVKMVVTGYNLPCDISVRAAKLPFVFIISGTIIPHYFKKRRATFPDVLENSFTRLQPQFFKKHIFNWYAARARFFIGSFNHVGKNYGVPPFKHTLDLFKGDYTLISDLPEFLDIKPSEEFPPQNYIGPLLAYLNIKPDFEVAEHLRRPGRSIFFSMGSSGDKTSLLKVLNALSHTNYNVIAVYTSILKEGEIPKVKENILLKKFVPAVEEVNRAVDLAIIHGGQGTVYTAAYSGKPVIGIPMQLEQQYNLGNLVRNGIGLMLSKKYFEEKKLLKAIDEIFSNYDRYLKNAKNLAERLPKVEGAKIGAKRILEIVENHI